MSFSTYKGLARRSSGTYTGAAGTAIDTTFANFADTLAVRGHDVHTMYGAVGDGSANDTSAIQAALDAAHAAGGGAVLFPPGTYSCSDLTWYHDVALIGAGALKYRDPTSGAAGSTAVSCIKARTGTTAMLSITASRLTPVQRIHGLMFDGNSVSNVIGISLKGIYFWDFDDFVVMRCATAIKLRASLSGYFRHCWIQYNTIGVDADLDTLSVEGDVQANNIHFTDCLINDNSSWAVSWNKPALACFHHTNFERNGTSGNSSTGCINITNPIPNGEGVGLLLDTCWAEINYGHSVVKVGSAGNSRGLAAVLRNCLIDYISGGTAATYGVYVNGGGTATKVYVDGTTIGPTGSGTSIYLDGSAATCYQGPGDISSTGGSGTFVTWATGGGGGTSYRAAVIASSPIYFCRLNTSGSTQTAITGTDITLHNGALDSQAGAMSADTTDASCFFDGSNDYGDSSLDMSSHTKYAIECWFKVSSWVDGNTLFSIGDLHTETAFQFYYYSGNVVAQLHGVTNNLWAEAAVAAPSTGTWHHLAVIVDRSLSSHEITNIIIDGTNASISYVDTNDTTGAASATAKIVLGASWQSGSVVNNHACNLQDFAVYGTTVPSVADFQAHYADRTVAYP